MKHHTDEQLAEAVETSRSLASVLRKLDLIPAGGNYLTIKKAIRENKLSTKHFTGQGHLKGKKNPHVPKPRLEDVLVENSTYTSSSHLKERLLKEGVFERKCQRCNNTEWFGDPIPLELDHKNGVKNDHRKENLRLLCPNCHASTPTYRGRNIKRRGGGTGRRPSLKTRCP